MKAALSIGVLMVGFSCVWANSWFYHKRFDAVIRRVRERSFRMNKKPRDGAGLDANIRLFAVHQHYERIRHHLRTRSGLLGCGLRRFLKIGGPTDPGGSFFRVTHFAPAA